MLSQMAPIMGDIDSPEASGTSKKGNLWRGEKGTCIPVRYFHQGFAHSIFLILSTHIPNKFHQKRQSGVGLRRLSGVYRVQTVTLPRSTGKFQARIEQLSLDDLEILLTVMVNQLHAFAEVKRADDGQRAELRLGGTMASQWKP